MSEGLDRKEAGEEPDGTLEDARKEFLEKYDDVGEARQLESNTSDSSAKDNTVSEAHGSDPKTEPAHLEKSTGDSDATLEEFRQHTLEKHEESGPAEPEGKEEKESLEDDLVGPEPNREAAFEAQPMTAEKSNLNSETTDRPPQEGDDVNETMARRINQDGPVEGVRDSGAEPISSAPKVPAETQLGEGIVVGPGLQNDRAIGEVPEAFPPQAVDEVALRLQLEENNASEATLLQYGHKIAFDGHEAAPEKPEAGRVESEAHGSYPSPASENEPEASEARKLEAVDYGKGAVVRFPKSDIEAGGAELEQGENAVIGMRVKDVQTEESETVFARFNAADRRAEAYVNDIGGEKGSRYELLEAWKVDEDGLVSEFEKGKCEHLENVRLEHVDDKMFLNVDNRRVELEDYRISTNGAHVVLRGKLNEDDSCKIEFDGRRASVMYGRDYPVEAMKMEGDELVVRYAQSRNEKHEKRMYLEHLETPERPSLNQFDRKEMLDHVKMIDHPERINGLYQFVLDKEAQGEIKRLLEDADRRGGMQYEGTKAEISERLVPNLLEVCGWKMIERHPFSTKGKDSASANGTDWLVQTPDGKRVLLEVKWYENKGDAIRKATTQVEEDFQDYKDDPRLKLEGAYIAIMEHNEDNKDDSPIRIHVLRIQPVGELL